MHICECSQLTGFFLPEHLLVQRVRGDGMVQCTVWWFCYVIPAADIYIINHPHFLDISFRSIYIIYCLLTTVLYSVQDTLYSIHCTKLLWSIQENLANQKSCSSDFLFYIDVHMQLHTEKVVILFVDSNNRPFRYEKKLTVHMLYLP